MKIAAKAAPANTRAKTGKPKEGFSREGGRAIRASRRRFPPPEYSPAGNSNASRNSVAFCRSRPLQFLIFIDCERN